MSAKFKKKDKVFYKKDDFFGAIIQEETNGKYTIYSKSFTSDNIDGANLIKLELNDGDEVSFNYTKSKASKTNEKVGNINHKNDDDTYFITTPQGNFDNIPFTSLFLTEHQFNQLATKAEKSQTQEVMFYVTVNDGTYSVFNKYIDGAIPVGKTNNHFYVKI